MSTRVPVGKALTTERGWTGATHLCCKYVLQTAAQGELNV